MEDDAETSIILGHPFLKTGRTLIDVDKSLLILQVADEQVPFNVFEATKYPVESDSCFRVDVVEKAVSQKFKAEEFRNETYETAKIFKERTKKWHDKHILRKEFFAGQKVLLFNSCLRLFPRKLKSHWSGPFTILQVFCSGVIEVRNDEKALFSK
ncbi:hypothetical protein L3X38_033398 [Prunus dulcis]|uniref:Uncharacterized protein n=1 Tax=Prunus dulcis TaxID=3755 RepID=A0AAD4YWU8_PRUDU|nr:hypothetical protein L3X38_033398 [Prunus dulcis]